MDERNKSYEKEIHNIIMENRSKLEISAVNEVISFDENIIILDTAMGVVEVTGEELHINQLDVKTGELTVTGEVYGIKYNDNASKNQGSFISKLFK